MCACVCARAWILCVSVRTAIQTDRQRTFYKRKRLNVCVCVCVCVFGFALRINQVGKVRFTKEKTERNTAWWVLFIVFVSLFGVLLIAFVALGVPALLSGRSVSEDEMPHQA